MTEDIAIHVNNLSKVYKLYNAPSDRFKETFHPFRKKYHHDFYALRDVSFEVRRGETIGIIGKNGSGKSTLLKVLTGVLTPSAGTVNIHGTVSALLELGAGFNPEFTGIENVYLSGTIMGYTREEMAGKIDDILSFADIGEFVNQPVKMYSSGMFVRLAFAVAVQVEPQILIVDEALSVGDIFFQAKCMLRMKNMIDNEGTTLLFVSHSMDAVKSLCKRSILLNNGEILLDGKSSDAVEKYFEMKVGAEQMILDNNTMGRKNTSFKSGNPDESFMIPSEDFLKTSSFQRIRNGKAEFVNICLLDEEEKKTNNVKFGQGVILRMVLRAYEDIYDLGYGYHIRDKNGTEVIYGSASIEEKRLENIKKGDVFVIDWKFTLQLLQGSYTIACVASIPIDVEIGKVDFCDFIPIAVQFEMERRLQAPVYALVYIDNDVNIRRINKQ